VFLSLLTTAPGQLRIVPGVASPLFSIDSTSPPSPPYFFSRGKFRPLLPSSGTLNTFSRMPLSLLSLSPNRPGTRWSLMPSAVFFRGPPFLLPPDSRTGKVHAVGRLAFADYGPGFFASKTMPPTPLFLLLPPPPTLPLFFFSST